MLRSASWLQPPREVCEEFQDFDGASSRRPQLLDLLDQMQLRFHLAMLFITHDLRVAAQVCDRIAVMYQGEVVEQGPAAEVFSRPTHAYTRALFDAAPGRQWEFGKFNAA